MSVSYRSLSAAVPAEVKVEEPADRSLYLYTSELDGGDPCPIENVLVWKELIATYSYRIRPDEDVQIITPGVAPVYRAPSMEKGVQLTKDSIGRFVDENGARLGKVSKGGIWGQSMEPALWAMAELKRPSRLGDLDLIMDRNVVKQLLNFVTHQNKQIDDKTRYKGFVTNFRAEGWGFVKVTSSPEGMPQLNGKEFWFHSASAHLHPDCRSQTMEWFRSRDPKQREIYFSLGDEKLDKKGGVTYDIKDFTFSPTGLITDDKSAWGKRVGVLLTKTGTMIFKRMDEEVVESKGKAFFGKSFEDEFSFHPEDGASGYWEINEFEFLGRRLAVRCETDCVKAVDENASNDVIHRSERPLYNMCQSERKLACDLKRDSMLSFKRRFSSCELKCLSNFSEKGMNPSAARNNGLQQILGNTSEIIIATHNRGFIREDPMALNLSQYSEVTGFDVEATAGGLVKVAALLEQLRLALTVSKGEGVPHELKLNFVEGEVHAWPSERAQPVSMKAVENMVEFT